MLHSISSATGHSLRDLLGNAEIHGAGDVRFCSCTADSQSCQSGDVFVAIAGSKSDGHDFAAEAVAAGAVAVVAERPLNLSVPTFVVSDTRSALARICQHLAGQPSRRLRVIGITGTNGKTTTTRLVAAILNAAGHRAGTLGTLGYCDGDQTEPAELTTPSSPALAHWLARMVANDCTHAVMEVSSHALAQRRVAGIEFAQACVTNLRRDHLDFHGTLANYHRAKMRLFDQLRPDGRAIVNADDALSREHAPLLPGAVISVGVAYGADLSATLLERSKSEQTFLLSWKHLSVPVRTAMIGDHHVTNCLLAAAIGLAEGIDLMTIVRGLESVDRVPGRLERIECGQPFGAYVDFAHTPDALAVSLDTLREVTPGRLICVFGAGGNRDAAKRPLMGHVVESRADVTVVTTDNPRFEDPQAIASEILGGLEKPSEARWIADRTEAIHYALWLAGPDDTVLIAGRGHETTQQVGDQRLPLDDREVVRSFLYNLAPASRYGALAGAAPS